MTETPCAMIGGPLDGELRVVADSTLLLTIAVRGQRPDYEGPPWAGYRRSRDEPVFDFVCDGQTAADVAVEMFEQRETQERLS